MCYIQLIAQADTSSASLPRYPAGEKSWYNFLQKNFNSDSLKQNLPDSVEFRDTMYWKLCFDEKGKIERAEFYAAQSPYFEKELRRLIKKSQNWIPAKSPTGPIKGARSWRLVAIIMADMSSLLIEPADFPGAFPR